MRYRALFEPASRHDAEKYLQRLRKREKEFTLTLDVSTHVVGPCQRCLNDADIEVDVRGVDYVRHGGSETEDEGEGYVEAHQLDVASWVRDLIADGLPQKLLCREDCRGLCPRCGADLNADPDHRHEEA